MLEKEIQKAYETMGPDEDARERMLGQIRTAVSSEHRRKESKMMRSHKRNAFVLRQQLQPFCL